MTVDLSRFHRDRSGRVSLGDYNHGGALSTAHYCFCGHPTARNDIIGQLLWLSLFPPAVTDCVAPPRSCPSTGSSWSRSDPDDGNRVSSRGGPRPYLHENPDRSSAVGGVRNQCLRVGPGGGEGGDCVRVVVRTLGVKRLYAAGVFLWDCSRR